MARAKKKRAPKQGPPLQFRPGAELERLVVDFAARHHIESNEACKALVALAVTGLDARYYGLMRQLADALGGTNAFIRACVRVDTALHAARRASGRLMQLDPERALFIQDTVREFLVDNGAEASQAVLAFLPDQRTTTEEQRQPARDQSEAVPRPGRHEKKKRTIRKVDDEDSPKPGPESRLATTEEEPEWSSIEEEGPQQQHTRS